MNIISSISILLAMFILCCNESSFAYSYQQKNYFRNQQQNSPRYQQEPDQMYSAQTQDNNDYGDDEQNLEEDALNDPDAPD